MASQAFRYARMLGVDFIRDRQKKWWLLEVNDVPSGLAHIDSLQQCQSDLAFPVTHGAVASIAAELLREDEGVAVILRPPPHFQAFPCKRAAEFAEADYAAVAAKVRSAGQPCAIVTPAELSIESGLQLRDGTRIHSVYRRTHVRPDCEVAGHTINPVPVVHVCRDKLRLSDFIGAVSLGIVPTHLTDNGAVQLDVPGNGYWIIKPRFGAASEGVSRVRATELDHISSSRSDCLLQPWIEPDTLACAGRDYYYDLRIVVFDGRIVGAVARSAAAPSSFSDTSLSWLTTLGTTFPVLTSTRSKQDGCVILDTLEIEMLTSAVMQIAAFVESATTSYVNAFPLPTREGAELRSKEVPVLFISSGSDSDTRGPCAAAIEATFDTPLKPAVCDITADADEQAALEHESGWCLTPQLYYKGDFFLGSRVIQEAARSRELERTASHARVRAWKHVRWRRSLTKLPTDRHAAEVWSVSSSTDGKINASASADGTVRVTGSSCTTRYALDDCWVNCASLCPDGTRLLIGTSKSVGYSLSLSDEHVTDVAEYQGHQRWINGVVAIDDSSDALVSADGVISLWRNGRLVATNKHSLHSGHVLGMRRRRGSCELMVWSSDGCISWWDIDGLTPVRSTRIKCGNYITTVCEAGIDGQLVALAIDIKGVVHASGREPSFAHIGTRAWGMAANDAIGMLAIASIDGKLHKFRYNQPVGPPTATTLGVDSPTVCDFVADSSSLIIGFASGEVQVYER